MTTTLANCSIELSKQIGDYWASTTTGAGSTTTLVDTALMAKANDWITDDTWAILTEEPVGAAAIYDERKVSSLDNTTGTLTTLAFAAAPGTGIDYELHRLFSPSEKRRALIWAARNIYPNCFSRIRDTSKVFGNWLKDGSFEVWTSTSVLTHWTTTTSTLAQTSTNGLFKHGTYSAKLSTAAGNICESVTNWDDLKKLAGKTVTFSAQGWCDTASCLRLGIYDGTTYTYSDYHPGTSDYTEDSDPLSVTATIADTPTGVYFYIYHAVALGTSYVDDARVIGPENTRVYIGDLGLAQNTPHRVSVLASDYDTADDWTVLHDIVVDHENGFFTSEEAGSKDMLLIEGIAYLNFFASGVASTAWTATIDIESPQLDILIALAAYHLSQQRIMPIDVSGDSAKWQEAVKYWAGEYERRRNLFKMIPPRVVVNWGL